MSVKRRHYIAAPMILLISGCINEGWHASGDAIQSEAGIVTFPSFTTRTFNALDAFSAHSDITRMIGSKTIAIETVIAPDGPQSKILDFTDNWKQGDPPFSDELTYHVVGSQVIAIPCQRDEFAMCVQNAPGDFVESGGKSQIAFSTSGTKINILQNSGAAPLKATIDLAAIKAKPECKTKRTPKYGFGLGVRNEVDREKRCPLDLFYKQNSSSFVIHYDKNIVIYEVQSGIITGKTSTNFSARDYEITDIVRSGDAIKYIYCTFKYNKLKDKIERICHYKNSLNNDALPIKYEFPTELRTANFPYFIGQSGDEILLRINTDALRNWLGSIAQVDMKILNIKTGNIRNLSTTTKLP